MKIRLKSIREMAQEISSVFRFIPFCSIRLLIGLLLSINQLTGPLLYGQFNEINSINLIDSLNTVAENYTYSDSAASRRISERALIIAEETAYLSGKARASRQLGLLSLRLGSLSKARTHYEKNLAFRLTENDPIKLAQAYYVLTQVTSRMGDQVATLENLLKSLKILESTEDLNTLSKVLDGLGSYYRREKDFRRAQSYFLKSIDLREVVEDTVGLIRSYQTLGNLYGEQRKTNLSKDSYLKGLSLLSSGKVPRLEAGLLSNLGNIYYRESNFDSANYFYNRALEMRILTGNLRSQSIILNNLTALAFEQENYRKSIDYARQGLVLAEEVDSPELLSSLYYNLSDSYKALGDYKRSFEYYKLSDSIDYEITNTEKNAQLAEMQVKYNTAEKDKEIAEQNLELEKANTEQKQLLAGLVLLLLLIGFVYTLLVRKRKSNRALTQQKTLVEKREKEKALLLRELHHRVKNNFQIVSSLLNLQYYDTTDKETAEAIKSGQARVEAMSMIHRELYQSDNITTIEMRDYIIHLIDNTAYAFNYDSNEFDTELEISNEPLGVKYAIPLGVIINELITNAFKHAFGAVKRPLLGVKLLIDAKSEGVVLHLWDNGPGIPKNSKIEESSFGLELIHDLVKQLKGELTLEGEILLKFPYESQDAYVES